VVTNLKWEKVWCSDHCC